MELNELMNELERTNNKLNKRLNDLASLAKTAKISIRRSRITRVLFYLQFVLFSVLVYAAKDTMLSVFQSHTAKGEILVEDTQRFYWNVAFDEQSRIDYEWRESIGYDTPEFRSMMEIIEHEALEDSLMESYTAFYANDIRWHALMVDRELAFEKLHDVYPNVAIPSRIFAIKWEGSWDALYEGDDEQEEPEQTGETFVAGILYPTYD